MIVEKWVRGHEQDKSGWCGGGKGVCAVHVGVALQAGVSYR